MKIQFLKKYSILFAALPIAMSLLACNNKDNVGTTDTEVIPPTSPSVETNAPNTTYIPAFLGQTRASSVATATPISATILTTALTAPWGITSLPDNRLLITEKAGTMRIVSPTGIVSTAITGLPPVNSSGQGGLLGVCVDPAFTSNRMVYWVFLEATKEGNLTAVAKGRLSDSEKIIENPIIIYRANPANSSNLHYGGRILFDTTGNLLVSTGERSVLQTRPLAQSVSGGLGKIIRITSSGQPAPGNPKFSQATALPELYSIGHRNPQGIALQPTTGDLWQSEHGPRGGDEINHIQPGSNYGWPIISYGIEYGGEPIGAGITKQDGMEQPVYYWDPVISPSGITFYAGNKIPEWQNNLFVGALSGQHIARLVIQNNRVVGEERLLQKENQRFRDITQGKDNALYAITDQGRLYKIDKK